MLNRKENTRKEKKIIYIFTEGEKTEPVYFQSKRQEIDEEIRRKGIKVEIYGSGHNTLSLVEFAIKYVNDNNIDLDSDDCWVVFDKDDLDDKFDDAISKAKLNNLEVAYSNEAFELWFLLHFNFMDSELGRNDYIDKLNEILKKLPKEKACVYSKTLDIYPLIREKEAFAIKCAERLLSIHNDKSSFSSKNPSTTVHLLVKSLNQLKEE